MKKRIDCPKCDRDVAVSDREVIARHNRLPGRPCLAAGLTPFQIEAHERDQFPLFPLEVSD